MNSPITPIRVAVLDDDDSVRYRICSAIQDSPDLALMCERSTGQAMLTWLEQHEPDVLLVDLGLPDIPGLAVISYCAQRYPRTDIMVISMFEDETHVVESLEAGASGYLLKDSLHDEIVTLIKQLRAGGAPMTPIIARQLLKRFRLSAPAPAPAAILEVALTAKELDVLNLIARGFKYAEVAKLQGVSLHTVHAHIKHIYAKLSVHSRSEAVFEAGRMGLIDSLMAKHP